MPTLTYPGVYVQEVSSGVRPIEAASTSTAAFVGLAEKGPDDEARRITSWTEFQRHYGSFLVGSRLAESVFQFFNNGGSQCYIVRVTPSDAAVASTTVENREQDPVPGVRFSAKNKGAWGNSLVLEIEDGSNDPDNTFKVSVRRQEVADVIPADLQTQEPLEVHDDLSMDPDQPNYFATVLEESVLIDGENLIDPDRQQQVAPALLRPANATAVQIGDAAVAAPVTASSPGSDGTAAVDENDYEAAFVHLDNKPYFSLLAVPGIGSSIMVDKGMGYCRNRTLQDVFYIGEMGEDDDQPAEAEAFRQSLTNPNSYGAVYFPWIRALDPAGRSAEPILLPPSGYIAGLYARIDASRGVWKAPAGTAATLGGAVGLAIDLTDIQQGNLNRLNVNCLRRFPSAGIVSWGARTITSDPEYKYVPIRRMAILLRVSIYNGIQWAVFEPNDEELWTALRSNIEAFMMNLFRQNAFQGASPSDAFFVKVDSETTTQADIDLGVVNVLVGFAPLKPAEFVVVKISQKAGPAS